LDALFFINNSIKDQIFDVIDHNFYVFKIKMAWVDKNLLKIDLNS